MMGPSVARALLKPSIDLGTYEGAILDVYFTLLILGGHVGLPLALMIMYLTKTVNRRHPTLINLLLSWIVYATSCLILLYSGERRKPEPDFGVCLTQASMIYGSTVGAASATLCLVTQLWMEFNGMRAAKDSKKCAVTLLAFPWISFLLFGVAAVILGFDNPTLVSTQWVFYCTISSNTLIYTVSGFTLVLVALTLALEVAVLRFLYKATRQFRAVNQSSYHLTLRVTIFTAYSFATFIVSFVLTFRPRMVFAYLFVATLPLGVFLVFGTQRENIQFWFRIQRKSDRQLPLQPMAFKPGSVAASPGFTPRPESNADKRFPTTPRLPDDV